LFTNWQQNGMRDGWIGWVWFVLVWLGVILMVDAITCVPCNKVAAIFWLRGTEHNHLYELTNGATRENSAVASFK